MPIPFARRIQQVQPSATLAVDAKAKAMQAQGIDVVGFGAGEPDFTTPQHIVQAGMAAMSGGDTHYGAKRGNELKEAIVAKLKRENELDYAAEQVVVSCGAKHSLYNIVQVLVDEGDEAIIPAPYWVSYLEQVRLAGGKPVIIETSEETGFKISPEQLERAITPKTRLFFFNSPSNPTGAVYTPDEIRALAKVIEKHNLVTISDEIYERLIYGDISPLSLGSLSKKLLEELVITVNGVSKTYAMTGWRIGYAAGPKPIMNAVKKLQSHATSDPAAFSQAGACEALKNLRMSDEAIMHMCEAFDERRKHMIKRINDLPGVSILEPLGAFYAFANVSGAFGRKIGGVEIKSAMDFTNIALEQAKVAVVPGEAFGSPKHVRLSYATSVELIDKGLDRLRDLLK